jgi:hypothetical protein
MCVMWCWYISDPVRSVRLCHVQQVHSARYKAETHHVTLVQQEHSQHNQHQQHAQTVPLDSLLIKQDNKVVQHVNLDHTKT